MKCNDIELKAKLETCLNKPKFKTDDKLRVEAYKDELAERETEYNVFINEDGKYVVL
jgi:hypothetical protein